MYHCIKLVLNALYHTSIQTKIFLKNYFYSFQIIRNCYKDKKYVPKSYQVKKLQPKILDWVIIQYLRTPTNKKFTTTNTDVNNLLSIILQSHIYIFKSIEYKCIFTCLR